MKILVVDDEEAMLEVLQLRLESWGHDVLTAADGAFGAEMASQHNPDLVISDIVMPEMSGLELLRKMKEGDPSRPVLLVTAHGTVDLAVSAMKEGADDFITKPLDYSKLKALLSAVEETRVNRSKNRKAQQRLESKAGVFGPFVGDSPPMQKLYELIQTTAASDVAVLITGESGVGKELVARTIHELSGRNEGPFIAVNSAAIPGELMESEIFGHEKGAFTGAVDVRSGCFELAHGGTLFLDEIGEMPLELQPKLLRVLEDGRVRRLGGREEFHFDVRLVSATNRNPQAAIQDGRLRNDLFYRLNVIAIDAPPLRGRVEDIELLSQHFLTQFQEKHSSSVKGLREDALSLLQAYAWPGNVRELRNVIERAVVLAANQWIEATHLPPYVRTPEVSTDEVRFPAGVTAAEAERQLIMATLERVGNNKAEAARQLGLDVKTIRNKLKSYEAE